MAIEVTPVEYKHGDVVLEAMVAFDAASKKPRPVVLVAHAWGGRDEFAIQKARDLAQLGYVGFAIDLYGKGILGTSKEENRSLMQPFLEDRTLLQARMDASVSAACKLTQSDATQVSAIGFCFGGLCVLDLARSGADIKAVVSFHGLFSPPDNPDAEKIKSRVLVLHGYDDPMATPDAMVGLADELTHLQADWQIHAYGGTMHAFTNPAAKDPDFGTVYHPLADNRAWRSMKDFLQDSFLHS